MKEGLIKTRCWGKKTGSQYEGDDSQFLSLSAQKSDGMRC